MNTLQLTAEDVLQTTRAVRKRLDFEREVSRAVLLECIEIALQAPTGGNAQGWQFVFVDDADKRAAIADIYQKAFAEYLTGPFSPTADDSLDEKSEATQKRVVDSAQYLADNLAKVPVFLIPCIAGRTDHEAVAGNTMVQSALFGSIFPAVWSFMLAARNRGLGTCLTTLHLAGEKEVAEMLNIPYDSMMQVGLIPVAYTLGTDFKKASRKSASLLVHFNQW